MDVRSCDSHFSLFLSSVNLSVGKPIDVLFSLFISLTLLSVHAKDSGITHFLVLCEILHLAQQFLPLDITVNNRTGNIKSTLLNIKLLGF